MLLRIVYTSYSTDRVAMDLHSILATSSRNNATRDVTGVLGFLDGVFIQFIEGEEQVIERLYRHIERDPRHVTPRLIERSEVRRRTFPNWSMGLLTWDDETIAIFKTFNPGADIDLYNVASATAGKLFETIAKSANWMRVPAPVESDGFDATRTTPMFVRPPG